MQAQTSPRVNVSRASYAVSQVDWCCAVKTPEDVGRQLESDLLRLFSVVKIVSKWLLNSLILFDPVPRPINP